MLLLIDYREKGFIDVLKKYETTKLDHEVFLVNLDKNCNVYYKISNLDIGDFLISDINYDIELTTQDIYQKLILLFERKTFSDLSSSIIDGRFREQKSRIEQTINNNDKIMYIIEGTRKEKEKYGIKMNILESAMLNLIFKHKFKLLNTNNINDTFETIITIYKKYYKKEYTSVSNVSVSNENDVNENETIEVKEVGDIVSEVNLINLKKSDRINNNIFNLQLSVIPGVSLNIAKKISEHYKNMNELINAYKENNEELLANIQITEKRKIGKALSKKIYNAILNT